MKLSAIGYQTLKLLHKPQKISQQDFTVSYQWNDNLRERWINSEQQLEQWFDIARRPEGAGKGGPLTVQMTLNSELKISQNGNNIQFTNPEGTDITYDKLKVWDSTGRELSSRMQLEGNTLSLLVEDSAARYPLTIDPSFKQQAFIKASYVDVEPDDDSFGNSVAISGDTLVVGAPYEGGGSSGVNGDQSYIAIENAGAAYVFIHNGSNWVQQAYLKALDVQEDKFFGITVAISGDTVVVGGNAETYVFTRDDSVWSQQTNLKPQGTDVNEWFGRSVTIDGDTLVVGAVRGVRNNTGVNGDNSAVDFGAVYVFIRNEESWSQQAYLQGSNTESLDYFGASVDISGDTLVVGATLEDSNSVGINGDQDDNSATNSGAAYVFIRRGGVWTQQAYLKASNTDAGDKFGRSVAIFGDTLAVGTMLEDSNSIGVKGKGNNNLVTDSGAVYVYTRSEESWSQQAYLKASNTGVDDLFGGSVAISSNTLVVGARGEDSSSRGVNGNQNDNSALRAGAAFVFTRSESTWTQQAYLKASNTGDNDRFGYSVAISGDTLVMSSPNEQSNSSGVNGDQSNNSGASSGAAYVFDMNDVKLDVETLSIPIQTSSDDAEENLNDGDVSLFSSDLELIQDKLKPQVVGLRFPLSIPAGATILKATIQFTADETSSIPTNLVVSAEATAHALTFADLDSDISNRPLIYTSIPWTPLVWSLNGEAGPNQQTPDLSTLVQEIVDYGDWGQGNSIAFIISGNGIREAESFDGTAPPVLHVTFENESPAEMSYSIGDIGPGGGIVFYTSNEGLNGLEVALENQGQANWGCFARTNPPAIITGANGTAVGTGQQNTTDILAACNEPGIAAEIADLYQLNEVNDWFLPSTDEALLMYQQRDLIGLSANFWTSTENSAYSSFYIRLSQGDTRTGNKEKFFDVWPIRAF